MRFLRWLLHFSICNGDGSGETADFDDDDDKVK